MRHGCALHQSCCGSGLGVKQRVGDYYFSAAHLNGVSHSLSAQPGGALRGNQAFSAPMAPSCLRHCKMHRPAPPSATSLLSSLSSSNVYPAKRAPSQTQPEGTLKAMPACSCSVLSLLERFPMATVTVTVQKCGGARPCCRRTLSPVLSWRSASPASREGQSRMPAAPAPVGRGQAAQA